MVDSPWHGAWGVLSDHSLVRNERLQYMAGIWVCPYSDILNTKGHGAFHGLLYLYSFPRSKIH